MRSFGLLVTLVACARPASLSDTKSARADSAPSEKATTPVQAEAACKRKRLELVRFSSDGRFLVTAGRTDGAQPTPADGSADGWDLHKGERLFTFDVGGAWQGAAGINFSPDGTWAIATHGSRDGAAPVAMWSFVDGTTKFSSERIVDPAYPLVSNDGTLVAIAGEDDSALVLEMPAMKVLFSGRTGAPDVVRSMHFSEKDASLVSFGRYRVFLQEPRTMRIKKEWRAAVGALSPDRKTIAIFGEDFAGLVDAASGNTLRTFEAPPPELAKGQTGFVGYAHDGSHVALAISGTSRSLVWSVATGKKVPNPSNDKRDLFWLSGGRYVNPATASSTPPLFDVEGSRAFQIDPVTRNVARSWDLDGGCHRPTMCAFDFSPDHTLLAYPRADTGAVRIIRLVDGASIELGTAIADGAQRGFVRGADGAFDGPASCAAEHAKQSPGLLRGFVHH